MPLLLALFLTGYADKSVEIRTIDTPPRIDGVIEDVWFSADSAYDFVQFTPYEKTAPTESTVVYLLQDAENLYVAFRCSARRNPPVACLTRDEDYVAVFVDPFGSTTNGYLFLVYGSGLFWDGTILDGGNNWDLSWEGIWDRALKIHPDHFEVEMKIPFKTIRYKKDLTEWGIQFYRHIAASREDDYWTEIPQLEGPLMSLWGTATNLQPHSSGYYFELYPEGFVRYDKFEGEDASVKPRASLNLKWDVSPQTTINATTFPDFAQIESDPFVLNLSRYPTYLQEQRPFFIEGTDIFYMPDLPNPAFDPLQLLYTRRIGRLMDGEAAPIIGGLKVTNKSSRSGIGILAARTGPYTNDDLGINEPGRSFAVFRAKQQFLESSDLGIIASSMYNNADDYDHAFGVDAIYRSRASQFMTQAAISSRNGKEGWAALAGFSGLNGPMLTHMLVEIVDDSFDVSEVGFVPYAGQRRIMLMTGPNRAFQHGFLRSIYAAPGVSVTRNPGESEWSRTAFLVVQPSFRNMWQAYLECDVGKTYDADTNYLYRSLSFNANGNVRGNPAGINIDGRYDYNYARGFPAYQGTVVGNFSYSIIPPWSVTLVGSMLFEWDPNDSLLAAWPIFRPRTDIRISPYVTLMLMNQTLMCAPSGRFGDTDVLTNRLGLIFSWNFAPKSWFYVALNDFRSDDEFGVLQSRYQIAAVKAKYLLYF